MDLLYHVFIFSAIFFHKVSELNSKSYLLQGGTRILADADMNSDTYKVPGNYYTIDNATATTLKNAPFNKGFILKVEYSLGNSQPRQTFTDYITGQRATRRFNGTEWLSYTYFSDDATVLGQTINASDILTDIISDISEMDDINKTCIRYVQGALLEGKSIYGFVLTAKAGTVLSQIIFGSFTGVSGMAVRGKSGSPIQWKDWKIL